LGNEYLNRHLKIPFNLLDVGKSWSAGKLFVRAGIVNTIFAVD
jgi:hypothetical protein